MHERSPIVIRDWYWPYCTPAWTQRPRNGYLFSIENPDQSPRYGGAPQLTTEIPNRVWVCVLRERERARARARVYVCVKDNLVITGTVIGCECCLCFAAKSRSQDNLVITSKYMKSYSFTCTHKHTHTHTHTLIYYIILCYIAHTTHTHSLTLHTHRNTKKNMYARMHSTYTTEWVHAWNPDEQNRGITHFWRYNCWTR
jgi:hypothetical protein